VGTAYQVQLAPEGPLHTDLFTAITDSIDKADPDLCVRALQAAIEAAAVLHPNALGPAVGQLLRRLRELRIPGYTAAALLRDAQQLAAAQQDRTEEPQESAAIRVRDVQPDAPVPDDIFVPLGWQFSGAGIRRAGDDSATESIPAPVLVTRRSVDMATGRVCVGLAWLRDDQWHTRIVARDEIADARKIVALAAYGVPVTSNNAKDLVQWLADLEAANDNVLPLMRGMAQLGWVAGADVPEFAWGHRSIRPWNAEQTAPAITFLAADEGDDQVMSAFHAAGDPEEWRSAVRPVADLPRVKLPLYGALASPALRIIGAPNFVISLAGATSLGKTTVLRVCGSIWGQPDERAGASDVHTWDATRVFRETVAAVQQDLPSLWDDTRRARYQDDVAQFAYDYSSGKTRGRGSLVGIRVTQSFRGVLITTGETPLRNLAEHGGVYARVLECWGSPFGLADEATAQLAARLNDTVCANYGHCGPSFVQHLVDHYDEWPAWQEEYRRIRRGYEHRAGANSVASRMAAYFAALTITAALAHEAGVLPWPYVDVVDILWPELVSETGEADRAAAALRHLLSWAYAHRQHFFDINDPSRPVPYGGWCGRWDSDAVRPDGRWQFLGVLPHRLEEVFRQSGFESAAVEKLWTDRGWLLRSRGKPRYRTRIAADHPYLVAIRRSAIQEVEGSEPPDQPEAEPMGTGGTSRGPTGDQASATRA
jgi:hypothetical protein